MNVPDELRYAVSHEWLRADGTVGITDHAQEELTDVVFVDLPEIGRDIEAGQVACVVESVKAASDIYAPVSGKIVAVNEAVRSHPALRGAVLPERLGVSGSPGAMVTGGGLVFVSGGGRVLHAIDTRSGVTLWERDLGQTAYANPMTYRTRNGRQFIAIATGGGTTSRLVVFSLPPR